MRKKWVLAAGALVLFALGLLDNYAYAHFLYWKYWWSDVVMHLIGGVSIGFFAIFFYVWNRQGRKPSQPEAWWKVFFIGLIATLVLGAVWEWFEVATGNDFGRGWYEPLKDLGMGLAGSLLAVAGYLITTQWLLKK